MNQITLCGNLGKDFEVSKSKNGNSIAKGSLAITEKRKVGNDTYEHTNWFPIIIFGKKADVAAHYFKKGDKFLAAGKIYTYEYEDAQKVKKYGWQVIVRDFVFVNYKSKDKTIQITYAPELTDKNLEEAENSAESEAEAPIPF